MAKTIPKVKSFIWQLANDIILTGSHLQRRGLEIDNRCTVCGQQGDTIRHIFLDCNLSKVVWTLRAPGFITVWEALWDDSEMWSQILT